LHAAAEWIATHLGLDVPWHFTAFHPDFKLRDKPATPQATLTRARRIAMSKGLRYVYTGNVRDPDGGSTWCPGCHRRLIERNGYEIGEYHLRNGCCAFCGASVAGHFDNEPGRWGARRLPVRLSGR
jgi:pyruvate formate lyase activating enzyme